MHFSVKKGAFFLLTLFLNHGKTADNHFMELKEAVDEFLIYLGAVRGLSENTLLGYQKDLEHLMVYLTPTLDISTVTKENLLLCIGELSRERKSAATINRFIAAVRTLFAYCKKFEYILKNPAMEIKTVKLPKRMPRFMTPQEVNALCNQPEKQELLWANRDKALFEMLYSSGCRVSEIANLKLGDFTNGYSSAVVNGKGNKDRYVYFEEDARNALKLYLEDRRKLLDSISGVGEQNNPFVFINQKGKPLTPTGIRFILNTYSGPKGINHHVNPHAFRHTFATQMIGNGADVRMVQEMLGHASISTTQRYTHITTERLIDIYNKAHPHGDGEKK